MDLVIRIYTFTVHWKKKGEKKNSYLRAIPCLCVSSRWKFIDRSLADYSQQYTQWVYGNDNGTNNLSDGSKKSLATTKDKWIRTTITSYFVEF